MKTSDLYNNRKIYIIFSLLLCLLFFSSCNKGKTGIDKDNVNSEGIQESVERGPALVGLEADKKEITIAERINLSISIDIEEDYEVELPAFGDKLEQFGIVDYHNTQPELKDNNRKFIKRTYILEPFLSGDYRISPMKIVFFKKGEKDTDKHYAETPEVSIKVKSLLPEDIKDMKLNEIVPPLPYPRSHIVWIWVGCGVFLAAILAGGFFYYRHRLSGRETIGERLKAHEIAYRELKVLVDENLIDAGEIKQFYLRLSAIVRRYVENRFGLKAPEQTTEEFLTGLNGAGEFPDKYKPLLRDFLKHCDLVKFARFEPGAEDIQKSFDSCKAFIKGTEEQD
ncbi:MAG: hypothetical protein PVG39_06680 [Desulfobacteraceae bacterium]|jgi:hypothetical protein